MQGSLYHTDICMENQSHHFVMCRLEQQEIWPNRRDRHTHTDSFHCHHTFSHMYKLTCLVSFLSLRCCSRLSISSGGMGSPEQVWGWAL